MKQLFIIILLFASTTLQASDLLNATDMDLIIQVRDRQSNLLLNNHYFGQRTAIKLPYTCEQFPLRLQAVEIGRSISRNSCVIIGRQHCSDNIYTLRVTHKEDGSQLFYVEAYPHTNRGYITEEIDLDTITEDNLPKN